MTGITRRQAAEALGALFGTQFRYLGGTYKVYEVPDREDKIWKIVYDSSIRATRQQGGRQSSVLSDEYKVEMNSPKLEYSEMEKLQEVVRTLRRAGAVVNDSCGMHVHVDASNHTPQSLKNALSIMYSKEDILFEALKVNEHRVERWCKKVREPMLEKIRKLPADTTMERLKREWYDGQDGSYEHYNWTRYYTQPASADLQRSQASSRDSSLWRKSKLSPATSWTAPRKPWNCGLISRQRSNLSTTKQVPS